MVKWTESEDEQLISLVKEHNMNFQKVKEHFPGRSYQAVYYRYGRIDPSVKSGSWDTREDQTLLHWIFDDSIKRIEGCVQLFDGRKKVDIENRALHFKSMLCEKLFPGQNIYTKAEPKKRGRKRKRMLDVKSNIDEENNFKIEFKGNESRNLSSFVDKVKKEDCGMSPSNATSSSIIAERSKSECDTQDSKFNLQRFLDLINHTDQDAFEWTLEKSHKLLELYEALGNNWISIAKFFDGATSTSLEQRFYS